MPYTGYYINLDRSRERFAAMEAQLRSRVPAASYRRFPAVDGNPHGFPSNGLTERQIGCLCSHALLLEQHRDLGHHLHVIEDDAVLATRTVSFIEDVLASGLIGDLDVLLTSCVPPVNFNELSGARSIWRNAITRAEDGSAAAVRFSYIQYRAGTESYLVNRGSVGLVRDIIR